MAYIKTTFGVVPADIEFDGGKYDYSDGGDEWEKLCARWLDEHERLRSQTVSVLELKLADPVLVTDAYPDFVGRKVEWRSEILD